METVAKLARVAKISAIEKVLEETRRHPERVGKVLATNPDLLQGIGLQNVEEILARLQRAGETQALEAIGASRRCPRAVRNLVLKVLIGPVSAYEPT